MQSVTTQKSNLAICVIPCFTGRAKSSDCSDVAITSDDRSANELFVQEMLALLHDCNFRLAAVLYPKIRQIDTGNFFKSGFINEVKQLIDESVRAADGDNNNKIGYVCIDCEISALQRSRLQKIFNCEVITRNALIIRVFAKRARSCEGKLQVTLAHWSLEKTQLVHGWSHLERQRSGKGGRGFLAGPGEKQIELDRRTVNTNISRLKKQLDKLVETRNQQRKIRKNKGYPLVCLVGYTNVGKSTLFNALTKAGVYTEDKIFATLDTSLRKLRLPQGTEIILSDTVGFISRLPPELISSFEATLDDVRHADIILHIQDVSTKFLSEHSEHVERVLDRIGVNNSTHAIIQIWNKSDKLSKRDQQIYNQQQGDNHILLCATKNRGLNKLVSLIEKKITNHQRFYQLRIPVARGHEIDWLHRYCRIVKKTIDAKTCSLGMSIYVGARYNKRFNMLFASFITN